MIGPGYQSVILLTYWERGWNCVFGAVEPLQPEDFDKRVLIRGEEHSIVQAVDRQMTHYAYHVGQIVFLAKHFRSGAWESLSIPRNRSAEFNSYLATQMDRTEREHRFDTAASFVREAEGIKKESQ